MSQCRDIKEKLHAFLEGDISHETRRLVEEHLSACSTCSAELQDLKKTKALLRNLEEIEPPPFLKQKIMARIRDEAEEKKGILHRLFYPLQVKIPVQVFATCLVVVMALYVFKATNTEMKALHITSEQAGAPQKAAGEKLHEKIAAKAPVSDSKKLTAKKVDKVIMPSLTQKEGTASSAPAALPPSVPAPAVMAAPSATPLPAEMDGSAKMAYTKGLSVEQQVAKQKEDRENFTMAGAGIKESHARKAKSAAPPIQAAAQKQPQVITISVNIDNIASAASNAQSILNDVGAAKIRRESLENMEALTAEVQTQKVSELVQKLSSIWDIKDQVLSSDLRDGDRTTIIEIKLIGKK